MQRLFPGQLAELIEHEWFNRITHVDAGWSTTVPDQWAPELQADFVALGDSAATKQLQSLSIRASSGRGGYITERHLAALANGESLANLTSLKVENCGLTDPRAEPLFQENAPWKQLESLSLASNKITDASLRRLSQCQVYQDLERLDLAYTLLSMMAPQ